MLREGFLQQVVRYFQRGVMPVVQGIHPLPVHVEAYGLIFCGEQARQGQADVAEADDTYLDVLHILFFHGVYVYCRMLLAVVWRVGGVYVFSTAPSPYLYNSIGWDSRDVSCAG